MSPRQATEEALNAIEAHTKRTLQRQFDLERALRAYRISKHHRSCKVLPMIDARCDLCRLADAALKASE